MATQKYRVKKKTYAKEVQEIIHEGLEEFETSRKKETMKVDNLDGIIFARNELTPLLKENNLRFQN